MASTLRPAAWPPRRPTAPRSGRTACPPRPGLPRRSDSSTAPRARTRRAARYATRRSIVGWSKSSVAGSVDRPPSQARCAARPPSASPGRPPEAVGPSRQSGTSRPNTCTVSARTGPPAGSSAERPAPFEPLWKVSGSACHGPHDACRRAKVGENGRPWEGDPQAAPNPPGRHLPAPTDRRAAARERRARLPAKGIIPWPPTRPSTSRSAAAPTSPHAPQFTLTAGKPKARRWCASASRKALAAAWFAWPGEPSTAAAEENRTKKSRGAASVSRWRFQAPSTFGARTFANRSQVCWRRMPSSRTPAAWMMPRSGGCPPRSAPARLARPPRARRRLRDDHLRPVGLHLPDRRPRASAGARRPISTRWRAPRSTSQAPPGGRGRRGRR